MAPLTRGIGVPRLPGAFARSSPFLALFLLLLLFGQPAVEGQLRRKTCLCIGTIPKPIRPITSAVIHPVSGYCRREELIVTYKRGGRACVDPAGIWARRLKGRMPDQQ